MPLLWVLVIVLIVLALAGGFAVNSWVFLVLLIALLVAALGYF